MWRIEFEADRFLPFLPEECQSNPGVYGFELSVWVARTLAAGNLSITYSLQEDWGWLLQSGNDEFIIGCSSVCGEGDGYVGRSITWSIFVDSQDGRTDAIPSEAEVCIRKCICEALEDGGMRPEVVES
jgi:hypothetical protein